MFFFLSAKKQLYLRLVKAFPKDCSADVAAVCNAMRSADSCALSGALYSGESSKWRLQSGERISVPYRVYVCDRLSVRHRLTARQTLISHCIFSRSHDGYIRQKHVEALLDSDPPEWALPYIVKVCDEYVKEILEAVYQKLQGLPCEQYKTLCQLNFDSVRLGHCRMISYWNEFYRGDCYRYQEYIGKKLYSECFGYRKTGQKSIQF